MVAHLLQPWTKKRLTPKMLLRREQSQLDKQIQAERLRERLMREGLWHDDDDTNGKG